MANEVPKTRNPLNILVLGPTGLGGSAIAVELLNRGHQVRGASHNPQKLGKHENYNTKQVDLTKATIDELIQLVKGYDVVTEFVSVLSAPNYRAYGSHTAGPEALLYGMFALLPR